MKTSHCLRLVSLSAAAVFLAGCSGQGQVETTHLTIVTTSSALDEATSLAVAEYVETQGVEVEIQQHSEPPEVFAALEAQSVEEQAILGVLTAHQDPDAQERTVQLPETLEVVTQAPAELGFVAAASSITAADFASEVVDAEDSETPMEAACAQQTWFHPQLGDVQLETVTQALAQDSCEPTLEAVGSLDAETYIELIQQLIVESQSVVLLRGVDPAIPDQGLVTLDVETQQWPNSNIVAISQHEIDERLATHVSEVLDRLDRDAVTTLLRGYYTSQTSDTDLHYELEDAIRYWLAQEDLLDPEAVINITRDHE